MIVPEVLDAERAHLGDWRVELELVHDSLVFEDQYLTVFAADNQLEGVVFVDIEQDDREYVVARDVPVAD